MTRRPTPAPDTTSRAAGEQEAFTRTLAAIERRYEARLGVAVLDMATGERLTHRPGERFAFASTMKTFIAAATLRRSTEAELDEIVRYSRADLLQYAPVTSQHVTTGMTVRALLDAMLRYSDNTAANLLVARLGGPGAVQRFLRSIGDSTTSVDRIEPGLTSAVPGDRRDTTTPAALGDDLAAVLLGDALPTDRRRWLTARMRASTTGAADLRAGVPSTWTVADKTGSGAFGTRNDIALVTPPGRAPIVVVLLSARRTEDAASEDALLAETTRAVVAALDHRRTDD